MNRPKHHNTKRHRPQAAAHIDVAIIGAGLSGIGMAAHMQQKCPDHSFTLLERREDIGGTWDLFRYPGVRSDSDMHTLGFEFEPWTHEKSIADGEAIMEYLNRIVDQRDLRRHIRFGRKVLTADFDSAVALWTIVFEKDDGTQESLTANFLYLGSGYYDYDDPYDAGFDTAAFEGEVVHPQFWPEALDYKNKRVVVVGSGATAVTIVPTMAEQAASVTMLQRTPTWYIAQPSRDKFANTLRKLLPSDWAYAITRRKNVFMQWLTFSLARNKPGPISRLLKRRVKRRLGTDHYDEATFTPPYNPWEQRVCLIPDGDLFESIKADKADIATGHIDSFEADGVRLTDGRFLKADIIVTATGLTLAIAGKIAVRLDEEDVDFSERFYYKGSMFSNLPNLAVVFGYLNASWTLRADINSDYICRVLNRMRENGAKIAVPALTSEAEAAIEEDDIFDFSSGYINRSKHIMPRNAAEHPWRLNQDYRTDRKRMASEPVEDGLLQLRRASAPADQAAGELEAAE